jgi:hypothetical protein
MRGEPTQSRAVQRSKAEQSTAQARQSRKCQEVWAIGLGVGFTARWLAGQDKKKKKRSLTCLGLYSTTWTWTLRDV